MHFNEQINEFISTLQCTAKELATASNLTPATLSRYCNGLRVPSVNSQELENLANGIVTVAGNQLENGKASNKSDIELLLDYSYVKEALVSTLVQKMDGSIVIAKFNVLVSTLDIKLNKMAKYVGYDSSYLSRIKAGQRTPSDLNSFVSNICNYITNNHSSNDDIQAISQLINCEPSELIDKSSLFSTLYGWLSNNQPIERTASNISSFLNDLDEFDLDDYIRAIHFDQLKVPAMPFYLIHGKTYYKLDGMKEAELDFYKGTVLSKSMEPVFMFSDMPMEDMAEDVDFGKKWMFAIAMAIKKGLHLNVIHNLNRPFNELLLGLQSWIPLYMTGQISPFYFKSKPSSVFHQLTYVSGVCALDGQCIDGHHSNGKYTLYSAKTDVAYYQTRAKNMLSKASSLMDIYSDSDAEKIKEFFVQNTTGAGNYKNKLATLPIHTISFELLKKILERNNMTEKMDAIWEDILWQRKTVEAILSHSTLVDEITLLSKEEFDKYPAFLSNLISIGNINYTYEEYCEHIKLSEEYASHNANYTFTVNSEAAFRNIQIRMKENEWVFISKRKSPTIHFAIYHPKLVDAIWNFIPLVK